MSDKLSKIKILKFLALQKLAVISTIDSATHKPESALIAFAEDDELNVYFQTGTQTRKAQNLLVNPQVALVFGLALSGSITVQYEGTAHRIEDFDKIEACKGRFLAKESPTTPKYLEHPSAIFFKVTPTWIGMSDYGGKRPMVIEQFFTPA